MELYIIMGWLFILSIIVISNYNVAKKALTISHLIFRDSEPERFVDITKTLNKAKKIQEKVDSLPLIGEEDSLPLIGEKETSYFGTKYPHYKKKQMACPFCNKSNYTKVTLKTEPSLHIYCKCGYEFSSVYGCGYEWTCDVEENAISTKIHDKINNLQKQLNEKQEENEALLKRVAMFEKPIYKESANYRVPPEKDPFPNQDSLGSENEIDDTLLDEVLPCDRTY